MKKIWKIFVGVIFLAVCSGCGIKKEQKKTIEDTKEKIYRECEMLAEGYRNIYENAVKENALYELSTIQKSMDYFGKYGYAVIDSYNQLDMVQSIKVDDFLKKAEKEKNGKTTIFQVIAGDYFIRYTFNSYASAHFFYKLMDNGKTKTATFLRPTFIALIKPFKNVFQIFFLNSNSIICQQQLHAVFLLR